jgi:alkylation response protein AidB-like acyl-CoA dehydrogenase
MGHAGAWCLWHQQGYKIERLFRDAKMYELLEGTSEIQRELITKRLPR